MGIANEQVGANFKLSGYSSTSRISKQIERPIFFASVTQAGQETYLDGSQVLLVRLLLDPGVLRHFTGEFFCEAVQVGLVEQ